MKTKKILVPIDLNKPDKKINDFLYPEWSSRPEKLTGLKKGKIWETGMIVLTSEITEKDIFDGIIEHSGQTIESEEFILRFLSYYISEIQKFKIGNIVSVTESENEFGFELTKVKERVSLHKDNKIP